MSLPNGPAVTVVVLAAGEGTRMQSAALPKVLHGFAGRTMLEHVLAAATETEPTQIVVVVGHRGDEVSRHLAQIAPHATAAVQHERNGTGHAVRVALEALALTPAQLGTVVVLPGDAPLLRAQTLIDLLAAHRRTGSAATLLSSEVSDATGYGRVIRTGSDDLVDRVVEHRDASPEELAVTEVSALVYAFDAALLHNALGQLSQSNDQGEEYLPEVVSILRSQGHSVRAQLAPANETAGVNDRVQLAAAHRALNNRLLEAHMRAGVRVLDPLTTWVDAEVQLSPDVTVKPNVQLHGSTLIHSGAEIGPDCTLTDTVVGKNSALDRVVARQAKVGDGVSVGPFAYLRPGTVLADEVHIGTYVEIKNSDVGATSKIPHLTYVGDASIGEGTNIGAATVFVNYDGVAKHRSRIGNHARTGADNMFVAPVTVGDGAYTAAGSVITAEVPAGALAIARSRQHNIAGWVQENRPGTAADVAARKSASEHSEGNET